MYTCIWSSNFILVYIIGFQELVIWAYKLFIVVKFNDGLENRKNLYKIRGINVLCLTELSCFVKMDLVECLKKKTEEIYKIKQNSFQYKMHVTIKQTLY